MTTYINMTAAEHIASYATAHLPDSRTRKYVLDPQFIQKDVWNMYKKALASFWTVEEVDLATDVVDWEKLSTPEQHFIKSVLAFFASVDGVVADNCFKRFLNDFPEREIQCFYGFQVAIENIHSEMYSTLIQTLIKNPVEQENTFMSIESMPCITKKVEWAIRWMEGESDVATRLIAFACAEGILFSGAFCAIFWLKKRGLMPGLTFSNELISRDEGMHCDFACLLYHKIKADYPPVKVLSIVQEAVEIELEFIQSALPVGLIGINEQSMSEYIKFVADRLLGEVGCDHYYRARNPFEWMELISLQGKTNFFEKRVGEYQKAGVAIKKGTFQLDTDF
jgi:ribonucleoside-diphosphate reductase subunit M2